MNLAITTCAVWPASETQRRLRIFLESARRAMSTRQYPVIPYGIGEPWTIYRDLKITKQLAHLKSKEMSGYDVVLYSDGSDAFFTGPIDEIIEKYEKMGSPEILVSASHQLANVSNEEDRYPGVFSHDTKYCFPHVGGWLGRKDAMIAYFERMELNPDKTSDDCFDWFDGWRDGWFRPTLDSECRIFQVTEEDCVRSHVNGRLANYHTGGQPCILHMAGGYHDPVLGKDYTIEPWAKRLGVL